MSKDKNDDKRIFPIIKKDHFADEEQYKQFLMNTVIPTMLKEDKVKTVNNLTDPGLPSAVKKALSTMAIPTGERVWYFSNGALYIYEKL